MQEEVIRDWSGLTQLIDDHKSENWIYRGQTRKTYKLIPTLGRIDRLGLVPPWDSKAYSKSLSDRLYRLQYLELILSGWRLAD